MHRQLQLGLMSPAKDAAASASWAKAPQIIANTLAFRYMTGPRNTPKQ